MVDLKRLQDAMQRGDSKGISREVKKYFEHVDRLDLDESTRPVIHCVCCKHLIPYDQDGFLNRCVRIQRGDFAWDLDGDYMPESENVKFERYLCSRCYLTDPDLCAFFNRLGLQVR